MSRVKLKVAVLRYLEICLDMPITDAKDVGEGKGVKHEVEMNWIWLLAC